MKIRALLFAANVAAGVMAGPAASASADILIFYPPNPFQPPEAVPLVNQAAPPNITVIHPPDPGTPPVVTVEARPGR